MKVIFLQDVKKQAKKDEIKDVKDGYANYLISQKLAVPYTAKSAEVLDSEIKSREEAELAKVEECKKVKSKLENKNVTFKVKTGSGDKVFGSITAKQISEELVKMGFDIDKKKIQIDSEINSLGTHRVTVNLHKNVIFTINVILEK